MASLSLVPFFSLGKGGVTNENIGCFGHEPNLADGLRKYGDGRH